MKKTALTELFEAYSRMSFHRFVTWMLKNRGRLLAKEKEDLIQAADRSCYHMLSGKQYVNQTFKTP